MARLPSPHEGRPDDPAASPDRRRRLQRLRAKLARMEGRGRHARRVLPFGIETIDQCLPGGGLELGGLHELLGGAAASGFASALLARCARSGPVVWIGAANDLYAPGLRGFGLGWERLILVRARRREARLWALEEALRTPGVAAALAEVDRLGLTPSRRLQLAAEARGVTAFLLLPAGTPPAPSAALTRWRIESLPENRGPQDRDGTTMARNRLGPGRWQVELTRCRGGRTGIWQVLQDQFTGGSAAEQDKDGHSTGQELARGKTA